MTTKRILILDDDVELCDLLKEFLASEGFAATTISHPRDLPATPPENDFDLFIIDVMLPRENGFEILKRIRGTSQLPIVMLTARGEELDRSLDVHVSNLRTKFRKDTCQNMEIKTIRGIGYLLTVPETHDQQSPPTD
jgi:DNA-binding response OmpR family regulator